MRKPQPVHLSQATRYLSYTHICTSREQETPRTHTSSQPDNLQGNTSLHSQKPNKTENTFNTLNEDKQSKKPLPSLQPYSKNTTNSLTITEEEVHSITHSAHISRARAMCRARMRFASAVGSTWTGSTRGVATLATGFAPRWGLVEIWSFYSSFYFSLSWAKGVWRLESKGLSWVCRRISVGCPNGVRCRQKYLCIDIYYNFSYTWNISTFYIDFHVCLKRK